MPKSRRFRRGNRRRRSARLTTTGRLTLVLLVVGVVSAGWLAQRGIRALHHRIARAAPAVSAPPPRHLGRLPEPPITLDRFEIARVHADEIDPSAAPRLVEWVHPDGRPAALEAGRAPAGSLRVEYSLDERLTEDVFDVLRWARVERGHAMVLDPRSGRMLAFASTAPDAFPPHHAYRRLRS